MEHQDSEHDKAVHMKDSAPLDEAIVLGDAATLTRGGSHRSVEPKQRPYD